MNSIVAISGTKIRNENGLYSLNDLHKASGGLERHKPANWLRSKQTTEVINEIEKAQIRAIQSKQRLGTFVCKELVIHYGMWISPEFSLKVIRTFLDVEQAKVETINTQQQHAIREAVSHNVGRTGRTFQAVYHDLYTRFQIPKYQDLLVKDFDEAIQYLGTPQLEHKKRYDFPIETADPHDRRFANAWLTPRVILDKGNRMPDLELLEALEHDGYNVTGAKVRIYALYSIARDFLAAQNDLKTIQKYLAGAERLVKDHIAERGNNIKFSGENKGVIGGCYIPQPL